MTRECTYRAVNILLLSIAGIFCFLLTNNRVWVGDDLCYLFFVEDESIGPSMAHLRYVETLEDVWHSQVNHYFSENGRMPAHLLVQAFDGLWGKTSFAIVNSLVFIIFLWLCAHAGAKKPLRRSISPWWLVVTIFFVFYLFPPGAAIKAGPWYGLSMGINYLWAAVLFLCFLFAFTYGERLLPALLLAFFTGWWNEAFSVPLSAATILYWVIEKDKVSRQQRHMIIALVIGTALVALAPGTLHRALTRDTSSEGIGQILFSAIECYSKIKIFWLLILSMAIVVVR